MLRCILFVESSGGFQRCSGTLGMMFPYENSGGVELPHQVDKRLFTARQAAAYLGIGLYTLKKMEYAEYLKPYRTLGGHRRYSQEMLDEYLEKSREFSYKRDAWKEKRLDSRPDSEEGGAS
jgi:excisionase family DNA binding protein